MSFHPECKPMLRPRPQRQGGGLLPARGQAA